MAGFTPIRRNPVAEQFFSSGYGGSYGGGGRGYGRTGGYGGVNNPWQRAFVETYNRTAQTPYKDQWNQGVERATQLGTKDWTGEMRRFAEEDVNKAYSKFQNQLGQVGMRELALSRDVQDDWTKRRQDADIRASIEGENMQRVALDTMRGMIGSASGAQLDTIGRAIESASAGGQNFNSFVGMLLPLMEKLGLYGGQGSDGMGPGQPMLPRGPYNPWDPALLGTPYYGVGGILDQRRG